MSKGEDRNVTSIRRKEADQAVDEVGRPAAHGSPLISRSISARRSHPPYARQVEEHLNSRVYDWDRTAWSLFPPWRQQYFDGMETVRACGEPSYFVTVTANPLWPAIADALLPGQDTTGGCNCVGASALPPLEPPTRGVVTTLPQLSCSSVWPPQTLKAATQCSRR